MSGSNNASAHKTELDYILCLDLYSKRHERRAIKERVD